ncbi:hypothetical protein Cflav_PD5115 [Pedosphaera parvula Ellin514]|uniref:Uncharacterized protein n=1 Tax=Pedosphaera parvula (strain Ellin514) TaxID=320771 RepID=B9XC12_PEDPL|nr:hypothetical protein Cflav_PD5115 [Pedosphaera parvula Ellin514]
MVPWRFRPGGMVIVAPTVHVNNMPLPYCFCSWIGVGSKCSYTDEGMFWLQSDLVSPSCEPSRMRPHPLQMARTRCEAVK